MLLKTLLIISLLITLVSSFTLEGNWILQSISTTPTNLSVRFSEFVFRSSQIMNRLSFGSCGSLDYQADIDQDNIWINFDSQRVGSTQLCSEQQQTLMASIQQSIRQVLSFEIRGQSLFFKDPYGNRVMSFGRDRLNILNNVEGSWNFRFETNIQESYIAQAKDNILVICNSQFDYNVTQPQRISFVRKSNIGCSQQIKTLLQSASFFRRQNQKLQIYDKNVVLLAEAVSVATQQVKMVDTPILPPAKTGPSIPKGSYFMLLLQRRDLMRVKVDVSSNSIFFKICNSLVFSYELPSQNDIKISSKSQANMSCNRAPQQLYIQSLTSSIRYSFDSQGVLTLTNGQGKDIISLVPQ